MNSEIEVDASEVRVKKGKKGVILAGRKNEPKDDVISGVWGAGFLGGQQETAAG